MAVKHLQLHAGNKPITAVLFMFHPYKCSMYLSVITHAHRHAISYLYVLKTEKKKVIESLKSVNPPDAVFALAGFTVIQ